jgi:hypothetical protein
MRKRIINGGKQAGALDGEWLDVERIALVEITSEDPAFPIESAFAANTIAADPGWRAAQPGNQVVRLLFDHPLRLRRILLRCNERQQERTQEFVLRWSADGQNFHEVLRQQWNFSPQTANSQLEDFEVDLNAVSILELRINPDVSGGEAHASLAQFRLA